MLFVVRGQFWQWPVEAVRMRGDLIEVRSCPIPTLAAQRRLLEAALDPHCIQRNGDAWYFIDVEFQDIAASVEPGDPESYVLWNPPPELEALQGPKRNVNMDAFYQSLFESGLFPSAAAAAVGCRIIFRQMAAMLLAGKPFDLLLGQFFLVPYRVNWKEILCGRAWKNRRPRRHRLRRIVLPNKEGIEHPFKNNMCCKQLLGITEDRTAHWTLEFLPSKWWKKQVEHREKEALKSVHYWQRIIDETVRTLRWMPSLWKNFAFAAVLPHARAKNRKSQDDFSPYLMLPARMNKTAALAPGLPGETWRKIDVEDGPTRKLAPLAWGEPLEGDYQI